MTQRPRTELGFVKLSDSDFLLANREQDICGKDVYDAYGEQIGSVDDLYIDRQERKVRFLEVGSGGFFGYRREAPPSSGGGRDGGWRNPGDHRAR